MKNSKRDESEIQQSDVYSKYLRCLKWQVEEVDNIRIFLKTIPFMGGLAKIQRPHKLPSIDSINEIFQRYKTKKVAIEPAADVDENNLHKFVNDLRSLGYQINQNPFLPTKTIFVDLLPSNDEIFAKFSEAKRRAVRRALNLGITTHESLNIKELLDIKNKSAGLLGFITTYGINNLWQIFPKDSHAILLAANSRNNNEIVGGILLIFWHKIAYYWIAGAIKRGKKTFAPTLLVWEALKLSKIRGCHKFDFVGVWDERMPNDNKEWLGFTKFKEGFGGNSLYYPLVNHG
jgi:hypothetical protein